MKRQPSRIIAGTAVAAIYYIAGKAGLSLAHINPSASPFWPPTGIAIAALLLGGLRLWPGIFIAAFLVNVTIARPGVAVSIVLAQAVGIAFGNTLEALAGAWLVEKFADGCRAFEKVATTVRFAFFAGLAAAVSATIGAGVLFATGLAELKATGAVWFTWWMGDLVGAWMVAPLILLWWGASLPRWTGRRFLEASLLAAAVVLVSSTVFVGWPVRTFFDLPLTVLVIPLLVWAALRFDSRAVILAVSVISGIAIIGALGGSGPFAVSNQNTGLLLLQTFIGIVTLASLALAAAVSEGELAQATLHEKDRLLAEFASGAPVGLRLVSADGIITWANQAELDLLGYAPGEYIGQRAESFHAEPAEGRELLARLARGETLQNHASRLRARDGSVCEVIVNATGYFEDCQFVHGRIFTLDVTGSLRAEEEIRRLNAELEERVQNRTALLEAANKELEAFCYSVSHDLRAPLRSIRGFNEILLDIYGPQLDDRGREFLRRACDATDQMDRLIEDLLKLSRVSRAELRFEQIDLSGLATSIADELTTGEPQRDVEFVIAPECLAQGDVRLVRLVMENLLRNAWKFTGKRRGARIEFGPAEGPDSTFSVRDNGAGFDMAYVDRLFGVFQRLHNTSEFPGTGVGLAIVQRIINRHGGRVWATGKVDAGATFYFTLPGSATASKVGNPPPEAGLPEPVPGPNEMAAESV